MELRHPEYLAGIVGFALLLFLLAKIRKRGYSFSSHLAVEKIGFIWQAVAVIPAVLYLGTVLALLIALAAPFILQTKNETVIEGKIIVPCVDVSGSMDERAGGVRTKLQVIKDILREFLQTRSEVDAVGLTAFSGGGSGWGAGIVQRPTLSKENFIAASEVIKSQMFGGSTAIGEGIFLSILALNEMEWHKQLQEESGNPDKEFNIPRLWASVNTLDLPEFGLPNPDTKTKDDFIISEAVRLSPPEQNKNKVIILFSDGDSNTGLDPIKSIWLADRLGIKVYYVEVLSVAQEIIDGGGEAAAAYVPKPGASPKTFSGSETLRAILVGQQRDYADVPEHRRNLILAVKRTGGEYYGGQNYEDVRDFFMEISRLEKDKITVTEQYDTQENYAFWVKVACVLFGFRLLMKILMNL